MSPSSPTYQQALELACRAREAGDASSARRWAGIAARLAPDQEPPWLILGALANPRASLEYYRHALKINPNSRIARIGIRRAEKELGARQPNLQLKALSPQWAITVKPGHLVRQQSPLIAWISLLGILLVFAIAVWGSVSSMRSIVASAHLLPSATPPLRMAVRGNQLTPTFTPTPTPTSTPTPTPTFTPTPTPTNTPTPTRTPRPTDPPVPGNLTSRPSQVGKEEFWIEVNLSTQELYAHRGNTMLKTFTVSTGRWETPTVVGHYQIYIKLYSTTMAGPGYYLPEVPFTMYFYKGYGIHGTYWHNNFGTQMSHGCVNMKTNEANWIFDHAEVGTWVIIHY